MRETEGAAERAYEGLLRLILTGELEPGDNLPALTLAARLGTSRTPVREALRRLAGEGIAELIPGGGARLVDPTPRGIRETFAIRECLEVLAVREAAACRDPVALARLDQCLEEPEEVPQDPLEAFRRSLAFHLLLAKASGNRELPRVLGGVLAQAQVFLLFYPPPPGETGASRKEHRRILEAIRRGDPEGAEARMREHLRLGLEELGTP